MLTILFTLLPFIEDFESVDFPINSSIDEPSWYILDNYPTETNWEKTTAGSYEGDQSIRIRSQNFNASLGSVKQSIYTPEINCSEFSPSNDPEETLRAFFNVAYAKRLPYQNENGNCIIPDKLIVSRKHANQDWMVRGTVLWVLFFVSSEPRIHTPLSSCCFLRPAVSSSL